MAIVHIHGPFLLFSIFIIIFPIITSSITESEALLKLKQSFTNPTALDSWKPGTEPCSVNEPWVGITCENGVVSGLHLGRSGLSGKIDVDALLSLPGLRSVAFMSNALSGPIPDFHRLQGLRGLYLSDNQFSGEIPSDYFSKFGVLKKIWLSRNNFSGPIPSSLARLSQLMELHLENNQFSGTIPSLEQQSLISIDLSNNNLEGEIPSGLSKFSPNAFYGNPGLCGGPSGRACPKSPAKLKKTLMIAIWFLVAFVAVLLLMIVGIYMMRRKNQTHEEQAKEEFDNPLTCSSSVRRKDAIGSSRKGFGSGYRGGSARKDLELISDEKGVFGLGDLMKAAAEVLGTGALGSTYRAVMGSGMTVVVKRMTSISKMGRDKFDAEMRLFGSLKNKNVLTPLAYHYRKDEKLVVYEYQQTGSLMFLLHGDRGISHAKLNWPVRLNIIQGVANGLSYLHTELSSLDLPHGNLKSSNVLLSPDYEPLLVDYGLCSLISSGQAAQTLMAYKSPEAILDHDISPKCDVYCLGIIILEILTGKFPSQYHNNAQGGTDIVQWVRSAIAEGRGVELLDPDIANVANCGGEMERLLCVGADCTENNPDRRLDLREAIRRIELGLCGDGDQGEHNVETRTFNVVPSLRDDVVDEQSRAASQSRAVESLGDLNVSERRHDNIEDHLQSRAVESSSDRPGRRHDSVGDI
ncbi:hypothetical protein CASFOL_025068 [Castilleja foliolosa]|uniref:Protein kinase domain-containing protein n=1 Tax=Castilleja foliolosa TaxID=1961234 RepID=A0ABD3CRA4_9LAMI